MKKLLTLFVLSLFMLSCPCVFAEENMSVDEVLEQFQKYTESPELCASLDCTLEFKTDADYDRAAFGIFLTHCYDAVRFFVANKDTENLDTAPVIGSVLTNLQEGVRLAESIHGGLGITVDNEKAAFIFKCYHEEDYDIESWRDVVRRFVDFVQVFAKNGFMCDTPLLQSIQMLEGTQGISRSIIISMTNADDNTLWITHTVNA